MKPKTSQKSKSVNVFLSEDDRRRLRVASGKADLSMAEFSKRAVLDAIKLSECPTSKPKQ